MTKHEPGLGPISNAMIHTNKKWLAALASDQAREMVAGHKHPCLTFYE